MRFAPSPLPLRRSRLLVAVAASACGLVIGLSCNATQAWPAAFAGCIGLATTIVVASAWGTTASALPVAGAALGWHAAAMWWVVLAVRSDGEAALLWQALVVLAVVLSQLAWWLAC